MLVEAENETRALRSVEDWRKLLATKRGLAWGRWNHQYRAFEFLQEYYVKHRPDEKPPAALICMPTGSGKSGVIALACGFLSDVKNVLLVVPSAALVKQLGRTLANSYWQKVGGRPVGLPAIHDFVPSTLETELAKDTGGSRRVFVCTTASLEMLCQKKGAQWKEALSALRDNLDLVFVDEGHREPAPSWARAIRRLRLPTVLFSATPYRNDVRLFNVGHAPAGGGHNPYRFVFKFQDALAANVVRKVEVSESDGAWAAASNDVRDTRAQRFTNALRRFYESKIANLRSEDVAPGHGRPKVIVRCGSYECLEAVRRRLVDVFGRQAVVSVHDRYTGSNVAEGTFHEVPTAKTAPTTRDAVFWLHQDKLTEGIDDPSIVGLAFETGFGNARSLVQQLGRLLRNPTHDADQTAFVLADRDDDIAAQWEGYLSYERVGSAMIGPEEVVERFVEALPEWFYSGHAYRRRFNPRLPDEEIVRELRFAKSAQVYALSRPATPLHMDDLAEDLTDQLGLYDYVRLREVHVEGNNNVRIFLCIRVSETSRLDLTNFFDVSFATGILYKTGRHLFFQGPFRAFEAVKDYDITALTSADLQRCLGGEATIRQLVALNTDIGDHAPRRRAVGARNVSASGLMLNDHAHIAVAAVGHRAGKGRRALSLLKGRVTDSTEPQLSVEDFCTWANELSRQLTTGTCHPFLQRFAEEIPAPNEAEARFILCDLTEFFENVVSPDDFSADDNIPFNERFDATAAKVDANGDAEVRIGDRAYKVRVAYKHPRFSVVSPELDAAFKASGDSRRKPSTLLSTQLSLRVVTDEHLLFTNGRFFRPHHLWGNRRVNDMDFVMGVSALAAAEGGEKGANKGKETVNVRGRFTWNKKSIFGMLDDRANEIYKVMGFDLGWLICEDLGTEEADFLAIDRERKRLAVIHCKAAKFTPAKPTNYDDDHEDDEGSAAAGALQEVAAQAIKNLALFDRASGFSSERIRKWGNCYSRVASMPRIRHRISNGSAQDFAKDFTALLRSNDASRELWVVIGNCLSANAVQTAARAQQQPKYEEIQLLYLLHSLNSHVAHYGARLHVLASP